MLLPTTPIDRDPLLARYFLPYQIHWIQAEDCFHAQGRQAFALAEKSVRIGWTYADAFKNVRKRLRYPKRDYLFATKDYPSALEYMRLCYSFAGLLDLTRSILSHGEDYVHVPRLDAEGKQTGFTDEVKIGLIKFDNGSRIIAFSSSPQAMAVHAGDVGLDEFAKHPNARLLWETAQGRVTWGYDLSVWSAHDGEDTLFNEFAQAARSAPNPALAPALPSSASPECTSPSQTSDPVLANKTSEIEIQPESSPIANRKSKIANPSSPWNLYYRVTIADAIEHGLLGVINSVQKTKFTADQFLADCRSRAHQEELFQQAYMCNPLGAAANHIVEWSAIERCRFDYQIQRVHLEEETIQRKFGEFNPSAERERANQIHRFLREQFPILLSSSASGSAPSIKNPRLGFDVAASGLGHLAAIYVDEAKGDDLWLRALFTCRTQDWHFLETVLFYFLRNLRSVQGAGDASGLGRQICWKAASRYGSRFLPVNFTSKKHDLGFTLMNQLSVVQKRFPRSDQDIAADFFALRKTFNGSKWAFSEGRNPLNAASHCDMAWAAALATHAHTKRRSQAGATVLLDNGMVFDTETGLRMLGSHKEDVIS